MTDDVKVEETKTEETKVEEPKTEEVKEEAKAEAPAEEKKAEEVKAEPTGKFKELITQIEGLTALELSELVKALEERFGVSAAAPMAMAAAGPAAAAEEDSEKANYNVVLTNGGTNKIGAIKAVREILPELGLVEAKELVENAPKTLKESVPTEEAKVMKEKLEAAGAVAELQ